MSAKKTDFLRFNAYSIKDLITRKLSEDSNFTDQIYEGSNLAVLIDIVSYMYQCLVFQLNNSASESMFKDTQIYENMVRLVKFLDYNPKGCSPSQLDVQIDVGEGTEDKSILPFSYIDTGKFDKNGNSICFSNGSDSIMLEQTDSGQEITLYNGMWHLYSTVFTASGIPNETLVLSQIGSNSDDEQYVSHDHIIVYVYDKNSSETNKYRKWNLDTDGIFISSRRENSTGTEEYFSLYGNSKTSEDDYVYSVSLNEDHKYEIRFGDGNIGNKLTEGSLVYVFYLETNGPDGKIQPQDIDVTDIKFKCNADVKKLSDEFKRNTLYDLKETEDIQTVEDEFESLDYQLSYNQNSDSPVSEFKQEESVDDIRENAPNWFKTGYRLISKKDYEYFVKQNSVITNKIRGFGNIIDVKCMNNTDIVSKFYKWLYVNGLNRSEHNGRYYFDNQFFTRSGYPYIDPSDTNNIYLWIKSSNSYTNDQVESMNQKMNQIFDNIKIMTTEIQIMNPITVNFDICASSREYALQNYMPNLADGFDIGLESYLEITLEDNQTYIGNNVQQQIYKIIMDSFNQNNILLGQKIDNVEIANKIYAINGVSRVRTIWIKENSDYMKTYDGISFASWSDSSILTENEDLQVGNSIRHIEEFQYPKFVGENTLMDRIKIIKKQLVTLNTIKF